MISSDKRYLYVFQGFKKLVTKKNEALTSVERLDLWDESKGWELLDFSNPLFNPDDQQQLQSLMPKGCFVMQNFASLSSCQIDEKQNKYDSYNQFSQRDSLEGNKLAYL